ncbi:Oxidase ustYa [Hyphodiscus hymeniophilus]|uniref:Oxidase ustYa n=1 Tax=Hyphodiscus hymeniophilus TaxID=353542 RepID=A0A9P6VL61_9HELO|nr:Oxidase ustYa [Hyphodiscus hymeniophilus]
MKYSPLEDKSDQDSQPSADSESLLSVERSSGSKALPRLCTVLSAISILIVSCCLVGLGVWIGQRCFANPDDICPGHVQHYSPILKQVDTGIHIMHFNGSLLRENVFRQDAGPEVDAAWATLGVNYRSLAVPMEEAARTGLKPDQVKINEKYGGGYPANVEGLHHLHCLNLVRQSLYYNYDHYREKGEGAFTNDDNIVKHHVSHCLDIIRQQLMCQPDTGLLGQVWWDKSSPKAFVDFNTDHKCKNFDAIRQWAEERQIPEAVPGDFLQPPKESDTVFDEIP